MSRVAVTGANGFIGRYVVTGLVESGHEVVGLGRSLPERSRNGIEADARVTYHATDYGLDHLKECLSGCSGLIHLAGRRSVRGEDMELVAEFAASNLSMLDGLLRASLECGIEAVVQASSIAVYSRTDPLPYSEETNPDPASNYGLAKLFAERYGDWWGGRHGIPVSHLRLAACFGAEEKLTPALMTIADRASRNQPITISNGGTHAIDQIFVRDAARAFLKAFEDKASGPFNIGAGRAISLREIAETAKDVFDQDAGLTIEPMPPEAADAVPAFMETKRAERILGWKPEHSLRDGLTAMRKAWSVSGGQAHPNEG